MWWLDESFNFGWVDGSDGGLGWVWLSGGGGGLVVVAMGCVSGQISLFLGLVVVVFVG